MEPRRSRSRGVDWNFIKSITDEGIIVGIMFYLENERGI